VLVLRRSETEALASLEGCVAAVEEAFRAHAEGRGLGLRRTHLGALEGGTFHLVAGGVAGDGAGAVAVKLNGRFPPKPGENGQRVSGVVLLSDAMSGSPLAVMDSMTVTQLRTAAVTALVARRLRRPDATTALLVGAGRQAPGQVDALQLAGISRILINDQSVEHARRIVDYARSREIEADVATNVAKALEESRVVVTITPALEPLISVDAVRDGTLVIALGADAPGKQELDPQLLVRGRIIVDLLDQARESGELQHALAAGILSTSDVAAELGEVVAGQKVGRQSDEQVIVFDGTGTALQDVAAAQLLVTAARVSGAGVEVDLES
jgi:ornithine cyclodeaminase/alanine dehydrogenase-like protein (mu-crystallin family)